jgi:hypothetical protein
MHLVYIDKHGTNRLRALDPAKMREVQKPFLGGKACWNESASDLPNPSKNRGPRRFPPLRSNFKKVVGLAS